MNPPTSTPNAKSGAATDDPITPAQVRRVARLSRLELSDPEIDAARGSLASVLGYMDRIRSLNLSGVEPLTHASGEGNRLDRDVPGVTLTTEQVRAMAPAMDGPFVVVPKVVGGGDGEGGA